MLTLTISILLAIIWFSKNMNQNVQNESSSGIYI